MIKWWYVVQAIALMLWVFFIIICVSPLIAAHTIQENNFTESILEGCHQHITNPLMKSYREWLIKALQFIQLKNFDRT